MENLKIEERLDKIESLLRTQKDILNIDECSLLTGLSKSTIYKMTCNRIIPHYKKHKNLIFDRAEVVEYMKSQKIKTSEELDKEASSYVTINQGGGNIMNIKEWYYFKFQELTPEIRINNKMNPDTKNRLDCVSGFFPNNDLRGLTFFVNNKGQMYLYKTPAKEISKADQRRQATWMLTGHAKGISINLSSMFIDMPEYPQYGYGNPPHQKMLGRGKKPNPLFPFKNDLYLFILNEDYSEIELIIIPECRNLCNSYYLKLIQGEFYEVIKYLRENAWVFFDYDLGISTS